MPEFEVIWGTNSKEYLIKGPLHAATGRGNLELLNYIIDRIDTTNKESFLWAVSMYPIPLICAMVREDEDLGNEATKILIEPRNGSWAEQKSARF